MAKYGKKINIQKKFKNHPSTQVSGMDLKSLTTINKLIGVRFKNRKNQSVPPTFIGDGTIKNPSVSARYGANMSNPFYNYLLDNCITRTKSYLNTTGSLTTCDTIATGIDFMLREGDSFYIYDPYTFFTKKLTCGQDLLGTDTTLRFTSTAFVRGRDRFTSGSFVLADNKQIVERANGALQYKKFTLSNAEYKNLLASPYTLLAGETDRIHMPISCYIQYIHGADEMTDANLYIGHDTSSTIGDYWGSLDSAWYRARNSQLYQIGASTYGAGVEADYNDIPKKCDRDDGSGDDLTMYTSANFTSASSYIKVHLWYKTIGN